MNSLEDARMPSLREKELARVEAQATDLEQVEAKKKAKKLKAKK
jgi:hypothetical protein